MTSYPNLELLEYKAKQILARDEEFLAAVEAYKNVAKIQNFVSNQIHLNLYLV